MKTVSYHQIDAPESDYLYIKTSQLPNAGNGLYAAIDIFKDERISIFNGKMLSDQQALKISANNQDQYFIIMPNGHIMDSMHTDCFAKYANDAAGLSSAEFKNNAKIALDDENNVCLIAIRKIKAGEEVFCAYGKKYWKKHGKGLRD
ncbi:hypothetical protein FNO01nite_25920 [Flavobacterium noncentrifugens]|uniref:SET domain-containing protein n=1 Tax=Flavobacterium noncentrifugens TaxID=1128970 RepID=A0A1G8ZHU3_9FLAO|nr:SET domain-containing protein-lysine N-methyltransferase [Flavobacterium noncentrifugens]GEP51920.1 hypothetical protein FNO01nite_25920 [Flavobacterium noncentrifugens]SDK14686.1 hypothetical protein SAMN04487935_2606 [Flavobacterium noncentrifugens]